MKKMGRYRRAGALGCQTRIRAGFPRELPVERSMAEDRPSPYVKGGRFFTVIPESAATFPRLSEFPSVPVSAVLETRVHPAPEYPRTFPI